MARRYCGVALTLRHGDNATALHILLHLGALAVACVGIAQLPSAVALWCVCWHAMGALTHVPESTPTDVEFWALCASVLGWWPPRSAGQQCGRHRWGYVVLAEAFCCSRPCVKACSEGRRAETPHLTRFSAVFSALSTQKEGCSQMYPGAYTPCQHWDCAYTFDHDTLYSFQKPFS